jgi:magnesium transporter
MCGVCLALANFAKLLVFDRSGLMVAFAVSLTLIVVVLMAMLIGCVLPVLAKRIGFDPAVMASPFITTIVDAMSLLIYFKIAMLVLGIA